jgi:hypothetical protein
LPLVDDERRRLSVVDKIILSSKSALKSKYGATGFSLLETAVNALIAADKVRGLTTQCVWVDDPVQMITFGGTPPINVNDQRGYKLAVDAVANKLSPDYLLLLDGPDIIPHIVLDNPVPNDGDATIDSDLPYASPAGFAKQVARYLKVTRVVGRVPNVPGAKDPAKIINFLKIAASTQPQAASRYLDYYGLSASVWQASTEMSLDAAFGNHLNLGIAPPAGPPGNNSSLSKLSHFINCHGSLISPEFYGQLGSSYPVSLSSTQVTANGVNGTVVAAECCYGAQLYDPSLAGIDDPICISYLAKGALGFLGSTNIAYGPATSNGQADLMAQYFFENIVAGASLGRAFLQGRQQFITSQKMTNPTNLKTLAQFLLLGDPSVCPCISSKEVANIQAALPADGAEDAVAQRKLRRLSLASMGTSISDGKATPVPNGDLSEALKSRVRAIAGERGYKPQNEAVFSVRGNSDYRKAVKELTLVERVMMVTEHTSVPDKIVGIRHLIAHIVGDGIASIEECESR